MYFTYISLFICSRTINGYTMAMAIIPISLGQAPTFLMPSKNATIVANSSMTMLTEAMLMRDDTPFWRLLHNSPAVRTMLFMCMSATIMDVPQYIKQCGTFWFIQPADRRPIPVDEPSLPSPLMDRLVPTANRVCLHAHTSCDQFIGAGVSTYLKVGVGIETVRLLFGHFAQIRRSPLAVVTVFRRHMNWRLIGFLGAYAALYRVCDHGYGYYNLYMKNADTNTNNVQFIK